MLTSAFCNTLGRQPSSLKDRSEYSVEQIGISLKFYRGELHGAGYGNHVTVKRYGMHVQLGEICYLNRAILEYGGVFSK